MGLPVAAREFLQKYEIQPEACPHCNRQFDRKLEVCGHYYGMYDQEYNLYQHQLKSGKIAEEFVQADPWSSGPCFFLGLRISDGAEILWDQEEIDNA
jgi:hypothetical protein